MVNFYDGSWVRALLHAYPDIGLDKYLFSSLPRMHLIFVVSVICSLTHITIIGNHYQKKENQKEFFDRLARSLSVNPLNPSHWYSLSEEKLKRVKVFILLPLLIIL